MIELLFRFFDVVSIDARVQPGKPCCRKLENLFGVLAPLARSGDQRLRIIDGGTKLPVFGACGRRQLADNVAQPMRGIFGLAHDGDFHASRKRVS